MRIRVRELFKHCARRVAEAGAASAHLEALRQQEGVKVNENMRSDALGMLVPDWAHARRDLLEPERRLGLSELDVGLPERAIAPIGDVGTKEIGRFPERSPLAETRVPGYPQARAARTRGGHQRHLAAGAGALAVLQDAADLPLHRCRLEAFVGPAGTGGQPGDRRFHPPAEPFVDRPLFSPPVDRAIEDHGLGGVGTARKPNLDAFRHRLPAADGKRGSEPPHLRLGRAYDGAPATLAQPCEIGGASHAAVGAPHPPQRSVPGLHGGRDGRSLGWYEVFDPASGEYTVLADVRGSTSTQPFAVRAATWQPWSLAPESTLSAGARTPNDCNTGLRAGHDPQRDRWWFRAPFPPPRSGIGCAYLAARSLACGNEAPGTVVATNERYDPEAIRWETYAPIPVPRHGLHGTTVAVVGNMVYKAMGGAAITGGSVQRAYHNAFSLAD